jgi:hypothetical protein
VIFNWSTVLLLPFKATSMGSEYPELQLSGSILCKHQWPVCFGQYCITLLAFKLCFWNKDSFLHSKVPTHFHNNTRHRARRILTTTKLIAAWTSYIKRGQCYQVYGDRYINTVLRVYVLFVERYRMKGGKSWSRRYSRKVKSYFKVMSHLTQQTIEPWKVWRTETAELQNIHLGETNVTVKRTALESTDIYLTLINI